MRQLLLTRTKLGVNPLGKGDLVPTMAAGKSMTGDFLGQNKGTQTLLELLSMLHGPTGCGKQVIVSAAAAGHVRQGRRSLIVVPSISLGDEYQHTSVRGENGELYEYNVPANLDFRGALGNYHSSRGGTAAGLTEFLLDGSPAVAVTTNQTLIYAWAKRNATERLRAFRNLWLAEDESHHLSAVGVSDEDMSDQEKEEIREARTKVSNIAEYVCEFSAKLNSGVSAITATNFRGDKVLTFFNSVQADLQKNTYTRTFQEHWKFLRFREFVHECCGYDDPIETASSLLVPDACTLVYLCAKDRLYRRNDPLFIPRMMKMLSDRGARVCDLTDPETQQENLHKLFLDNQAYKAGGDRSVDVILAVSMMREGSDYLPISRIMDFAPSLSLQRTVQSIGRMMRRDISPQGLVRKDSVRYSAFFANLQEHSEEEKVREMVCDRINQGLAGMIGVHTLTDDVRMPASSVAADPNASQEAEEAPARMEDVFGDAADRARMVFTRVALSNPSASMDTLVLSTMCELRQPVDGKPGWTGDYGDALSALTGIGLFMVECRPKKEEHGALPAALVSGSLLARQIREAGFDTTELRESLIGLFGADTNEQTFTLLKKTLNKLVTTGMRMQSTDKMAATYRFSPHSKDKSVRGRQAHNQRRNEARKQGKFTALAPTGGELSQRPITKDGQK